MSKKQSSRQKRLESIARDLKHEKNRCLWQSVVIVAIALAILFIPALMDMTGIVLVDSMTMIGITTAIAFLLALIATNRILGFKQASNQLESFCNTHSLRTSDIK